MSGRGAVRPRVRGPRLEGLQRHVPVADRRAAQPTISRSPQCWGKSSAGPQGPVQRRMVGQPGPTPASLAPEARSSSGSASRRARRAAARPRRPPAARRRTEFPREGRLGMPRMVPNVLTPRSRSTWSPNQDFHHRVTRGPSSPASPRGRAQELPADPGNAVAGHRPAARGPVGPPFLAAKRVRAATSRWSGSVPGTCGRGQVRLDRVSAVVPVVELLLRPAPVAQASMISPAASKGSSRSMSSPRRAASRPPVVAAV